MTPARHRLPDPPVLVITDRSQARRPLPEIADAVFRAGCRWFSVREKDLPPDERLDLVRAIAAVGAAFGAVVGVHDDLDAARAAHALHLPRGGDVGAARAGLPDGHLVGISTHDETELARAVAAGADYVTLSPVFASKSKPGYGVLGLDAFRSLARDCPVPVIALGGIDAANAAACRDAGANGIAVMGEVMRAEDPGDVIAGLIAAFAGR